MKPTPTSTAAPVDGDPIHLRLRFPERPARRGPIRIPDPLREPVRAAMLVGAAILVAGALIPWIRAWLPDKGWFDVAGIEGASDGTYVLIVGGLAMALAWSGRTPSSDFAIVVAAPLVLGLMAIVVLRLAWQDAELYLRSLVPRGGHGSIVPGYWLAAAGATIICAAGGVQVWQARHRVSFQPRLDPAWVGTAIGGVGGAVGGFLAGIRVAEAITAGQVAGVSTSLLMILGLIGGFVGAWVGAAGGAHLLRRLARR